jgi:hypothetical protein
MSSRGRLFEDRTQNWLPQLPVLLKHVIIKFNNVNYIVYIYNLLCTAMLTIITKVILTQTVTLCDGVVFVTTPTVSVVSIIADLLYLLACQRSTSSVHASLSLFAQTATSLLQSAYNFITTSNLSTCAPWRDLSKL